MMYQFTESSKELKLTLSEGDPPTNFLQDHLEEFGKSTKLTLNINKKPTLKELEAILRKCHQLKEVHVEMTIGKVISFKKPELNTWLAKSAERNTGVHTMKVGSGVSSDIVEYLYYKYPNVSKAVVHNPSKNTVKGMVAIIKAIDNVEGPQWKLNSREELVAVASGMKSSRNIVSISNWMALCGELVHTDFTKCTANGGTTTFDFAIWENSNLIADIFAAIGDIHSLDLHLMPLEDQTDEDKRNQTAVSPFYLALMSSPSLEKLTFTDRWIKYQPFALNNNNTKLDHLKEVEITGTILSEGVLPLLSKVAPQLKNLTLNSCIFDARSFQDRRIILSQSHLGTLCIETSGFADYYEDVYQEDKEKPMRWIKQQLSVAENEYLFLHVSESFPQQDRYFVLQPALFDDEDDYITTCKHIPEDQYYAYVSNWPSIHVKCKSLKCVKLNLNGVLKTTIDLTTAKAMEDLGDWNPYKAPTVYDRMWTDIGEMEKGFDRERKRQRYIDNHGLSNSEDNDSQEDNSESSYDYYRYV